MDRDRERVVRRAKAASWDHASRTSEIVSVVELVQLQQMVHGTHFRASILRDTQGLGVLDPVLGVDHARISKPTFPPHPHAGFSAVSYVFADAETGLDNQDSLGTRNLIRPGGLHWTAAGRGVVHEEIPAERGKQSHLFQIFVNLPQAKQNDPPYALSLEPEHVPVIKLPGATVRVPIGALGEARSPLKAPTELNLLDIQLSAGAEVRVNVPSGHNAFVLPVEGQVLIDGSPFDAEGSVVPAFAASADQASITISAPDGAAQIGLFHGPPLRQPVHWYGPMAMASQEALVTAVRAFERGDFGHVTPFQF